MGAQLRFLAAMIATFVAVGLAIGCQAPAIQLEAVVARAGALTLTKGSPTPAMYQAIGAAATDETHGDIQVDGIDYIGWHDNGGGSVAYIFYVYFHDSAGLKYERFVRVLRTADGSLHVLAA